MKLTYSLVQVALAILEMDREGDGRVWGYALSRRSGVRSGVLYPTLDRMLGEGWLEDCWEDHDHGRKRPPRRYYTLTDHGRNSLGTLVRRAAAERRFSGTRWATA